MAPRLNLQCVGGGVSPHTKQFSDTSRAFYNSTQFWHYLPRDSISFYRLRDQFYKTTLLPPIKMPIPNLGYYLDFGPTGFRLGVPTTPSLDSSCQLQVQVVTYTSDRLGINQRFICPYQSSDTNVHSNFIHLTKK